MREPPIARMLPDGRRVHLHDGPIDAIAEAFGPPEEVRKAYDAAARRFVTILDELCAELDLLRQDAVPISILNLRSAAASAEGEVLERQLLFFNLPLVPCKVAGRNA